MSELTQENSIEFEVCSPLAHFPIFNDHRHRHNNDTYLVPTYMILQTLCRKIYWIPKLVWVIDHVRVMNKIQKVQNDKGIWCLKDVRYQVKAHLEYENQKMERSPNYIRIAQEHLSSGKIAPVTLGDTHVPAIIKPCVFGKEDGLYDEIPKADFGEMYHSTIYSATSQKAYACTFDHYIMRNGCIRFVPPQKCTNKRLIAS